MTEFSFNSKDDIASLHPNIVNFVPRYIKNRKDDYIKLQKAVDEENFQVIRDYCHKVVGTARSYHFFQLEEITQHLQELSRKADIEGVRALMTDYDAYIQGLFSLYLPDNRG